MESRLNKKPKHKELAFEISFLGLKLKFKFLIKW